MPKRQRQPPVTADPPPAPVIAPRGVYGLQAAAAMLGLPGPRSLQREIKAGRLAVSRRCGRCFLLGADLLAWLKAGRVRREAPAAAEAAG